MKVVSEKGTARSKVGRPAENEMQISDMKTQESRNGYGRFCKNAVE